MNSTRYHEHECATMSSEIDLALDLFKGRTEAVGTEEGGARRYQSPGSSNTWWRRQLIEHFVVGAGAAVGVYPMVPMSELSASAPTCFAPIDDETWAVRWGCVDFDEGDEISLVHARNLVKVLMKASTIVGYIERSRSKGYHVWVFASQWIPAQDMREALLAACTIAHAPTKEINPKQVKLGWDAEHETWKLGNYVRLPYPGSKPSGPDGQRSVLLGDDYLDFATFIGHAWTTRCDHSQILALKALYVPPPKPVPKDLGDVDLNVHVKLRLDPLSKMMLEDGPGEWLDRSGYLWKLANALITKAEVTREEAVAILLEAHDRHMPDKFGERALEEMERMYDKIAL